MTPGGTGKRYGAGVESRELLGFKFKRELQKSESKPPVLNGFQCEVRDEVQDLGLGKSKTQLSSLSKQNKDEI